MKWHHGIERTYTSIWFDKYPDYGQWVWVKTKDGIFKANYSKWDWSDERCPYQFQFNEGQDKDVIAWMPFNDNKPE